MPRMMESGSAVFLRDAANTRLVARLPNAFSLVDNDSDFLSGACGENNSRRKRVKCTIISITDRARTLLGLIAKFYYDPVFNSD